MDGFEIPETKKVNPNQYISSKIQKKEEQKEKYLALFI
jgi:hypothetical protein